MRHFSQRRHFPVEQFRHAKTEVGRILTFLEHGERSFGTRSSNAGHTVEIDVLDAIGEDWWFDGVTAKKVKEAIDAFPKASLIRVLINSPGGYTDEGIAIQSLLKRHAARVEVEVLGMMASAATLVALGGDTIRMHEGAYAMIHQAATGAYGFEADLRAAAESLRVVNESIVSMYGRRTGKGEAEVRAAVMATTWFTAEEAIAWGLADELIGGHARAAAPAPAPAASTVSARSIARLQERSREFTRRKDLLH